MRRSIGWRGGSARSRSMPTSAGDQIAAATVRSAPAWCAIEPWPRGSIGAPRSSRPSSSCSPSASHSARRPAANVGVPAGSTSRTADPCGDSMRRTARDHHVVVLVLVGIAEPERQIAVRLLRPHLDEHIAVVVLAPAEVRAGEVAVGDLLEAGGRRVARRDARRVADHPHRVLEQVVADRLEVVEPEQEARGLRHHRDLALLLEVLDHTVVRLHVWIVEVREDVAVGAQRRFVVPARAKQDLDVRDRARLHVPVVRDLLRLVIALHGDPGERHHDRARQQAVRRLLQRLRRRVRRVIEAADVGRHGIEIDGELVLGDRVDRADVAGLAVHDMEPVQLRYFDIEPDGSIKYLTADELDQRAAEIAAKGDHKPKKITHYWYEQTSAFANVEILYRPRGDDKAPLRTYSHILANLDATHMKADDRVIKHLEKKGQVAVMTKAASFLLWFDDFQTIRNYLLENTVWMISDASGIPPRYATPAGVEQVTYGDFTGPYFIQDEHDDRDVFIKMWAKQPHRNLPFRFGYPDKDKHNHMMITRRAAH